MYLFFDTETTGLPRNWKAPVTDLNNWPRMVQIAWILSDSLGNRIDSDDFIIKPENFTIPLDASRVHRITTERAIKEGEELEKVLNSFSELVKQADFIVAHNISFDEKIMGAEFLRKDMVSRLFDNPKVCTMQKSTNFCQISNGHGYKWPKLMELHVKLFDEEFDGAHDALADVKACARCFFELKNRGVL